MSASRTSAFLRNAHNSQFANNISTIAKNVSTDVVDTLYQKQQQQRSLAEEDLNATLLSQGALFSDFDAGMGEFGLDDLEQLDVPSLFDGDGDSFPDAMDALSFGAAAAAPTPGPSVMAPAPAPAANSPFNTLTGRISSSCDDPFADIFGRVTLHSQQRLLSPRASDGAESAGSGSIGSFATAPVKVKREQPRPGSVVSRSKPAGMPSLKSTKISRDSSTDHHEDLDEKDEREYQAKLATASAAGDKALIREIKNGREKKRRARMCSKFQELHDILNVTNDMMARFTGLSVADDTSKSRGTGKKGSKLKAASAGYEKKTKFKKAQVLNEAVKTIEGLHQTFQQMQAQIDALARENQQLKQQHCDF
eukprot:INCI9738.1.p1 GENE.INCI9738.1~~INCI9738.1.p1  ORF type:complete len:426 (-),score=78.95 INCI9738.1:1409-2503(-)